MIGWYTDNPLSYRVMQAVAANGIEIKHIQEFNSTPLQHGIFYGLLRGSARAMHILKYSGVDFHYIDNGYFDARYVNKQNIKDMGGTFRVVKNGMHPCLSMVALGRKNPNSIIVLPPSPYSANFHDTTPEDWTQSIILWAKEKHPKTNLRFRHKNSTTSLEDDLNACDAVISFNSMAIMRAIEFGKGVLDTNGCLAGNCYEFGIYDYQVIKAKLESDQFTLEQIAAGEVQWK